MEAATEGVGQAVEEGGTVEEGLSSLRSGRVGVRNRPR